MPFLKHMKRVGLKDWFYRGSNKAYNKKMVHVKPRKDRQSKDMDDDMQEYLDDEFYNKFKWRPRTEGVFTTSNKSTAKNYGKAAIFLPIGKKYSFIYNPDIEDLYSVIEEYNLIPPDKDRIYDNFHDDYEIENDYYEDYGDDSDGGTWYYNDKNTFQSTKFDAMDKVMDEEGEFDEDILDLDLEWVPKITFDEYVETKADEEYKRIKSNLNNYINDYTDKNLKKAHSSYVEVTFRCKEYFLVESSFAGVLKDHFLGGWAMKPDFWQKKLDFEKKYQFKYNTISD